MTPGKVLAALRIQYEQRSGNAANKDRKNLVAAWNWGMKYLGMPGPNPCLVEKFPEERNPRYIPPEADFWKVFQQTQGQDRVLLRLSASGSAAQRAFPPVLGRCGLR